MQEASVVILHRRLYFGHQDGASLTLVGVGGYHVKYPAHLTNKGVRSTGLLTCTL